MAISHGFELQREASLAEINSNARLYRHQKTGAALLSLVNDDENKVFGASFRTPPSDSSGVAHILEHSVLCGSRKYPVKAPFLELLKGSLKTFLNAMTYPDKTVYPVASTNLQDFYNLVDVYLDAVFHPRITPEIFAQEGWHYEMEGTDAPLIYRGVVFNEMKGGYSSPESRVGRLSQRSLYPDNTYGFDSGGDPAHIPDLTHAQLKAFHEEFYHPSNSLLFFYGDDDPEKRLEMLDAYLTEFSAIPVNSQIALQQRFEAPKKIEQPLPLQPSETGQQQARVTVNWMLDEINDTETELALGILDHILGGNSASPLRKALIDSGFGDGVTGIGFSTVYRQGMFSAGLKGIDPADADRIEALIIETLGDLARDGIDPNTIDASMNTVEFRLRENNTGSFPRGISVMLRALNSWNYDRDPLARLAWSAPLEALKAKLGSGERVFEPLIRQHLLDNAHRTTVLFTPDPDLAAKEAATERERLDAIQAGMSEDDRRAVIEQAETLKRIQQTPDSPEALATIPTLTLADLPAKNTPIPIESGTIGNTRIFTHDLPANGIIYLDLGMDMRRLPADLLPYIRIFSRAFLETGAGGQDFVALSQRIGRLTGGIAPQRWTSTVRGGDRSAAWFFLRAKAVSDRAGDMLAILRDVLLDSRLDNRERIQQILREERVAMEAQLVPSGHAFAATRIGASLDEAGWAAEQMGGISYLKFLQILSSRGDSGIDDLLGALQRIREHLVSRDLMVANVTADADGLRKFEPELGRFLDELPVRQGGDLPEWSGPPLDRFEGLTIPSKVNYVAKGARLTDFGYQPGGAAMVASQYLRSAWLWEKIRMQGGAYGAFSSLDLLAGTFTFSSYRDPNLMETLAAFDGAANFLRETPATGTDLVRSIIGTISQIDAYRLPDAKGFVSLLWHLSGNSDEERQQRREQVLTTSTADIRAFADALDSVAEHGRVAVLGSDEAISKANIARGDWLSVLKVL